jgi:hypothetical protein
VRTAFLFNTELTYEELLRGVLRELGIPQEAASREEMLLALNEYLLSEYKAGRSVLLIIDEAQNLSSPVLENIRMLSNLETDRGKPLQILLVGQPGLWEKVNQPALQQLGQRVTVVCHLSSLTRRETRDYIGHRLLVAGSQGRQVFTRAALRQVHRQSMGNPRLINVICDEALLYSFIKGKSQVTKRMIKLGVRLRRVSRKLSGEATGRRWTSPAPMRRRYSWGVLGVLFIALAFLLFITAARNAWPPGIVSRFSAALEVLGRANVDAERLMGEVQGEPGMGSDQRQAMSNAEALPTGTDGTLLPVMHSFLEGTVKQVAPREGLQQSVTAAQPAIQGARAAVTQASSTDVLHEVRPGDTLAAVAMAHYGRADPMILNLIRRHNSALADINQITPGWRLGLPPLSPYAWVRRLDDGGFAALVSTTPSAWEATRTVDLLSREGLHVRSEALRVSAGTEWFEVLVTGLSSADEAARVGAIYQKRWGQPSQVRLSATREK